MGGGGAKTAGDLFLLKRFAFAGEAGEGDWEHYDKETNALISVHPQKNKLISGAVSAGETLIVNSFIWVPARFILKEDWAYISRGSALTNLHWSAWRWETNDSDSFFNNQIMHPYQGMLYHTAARANGFNYYESFLFSMFGSYTWETFAENMHPSTNDFITTVAGGSIMGEMFHRLFIELYTAYPVLGATAGFFISEIEWAHSFILRQGVRERSRNTIHELSLTTGFCWSAAEFNAGNSALAAWREPGAFADIRIVYGNPFQQRSTIPFNQFELNLSANGAEYFNLTLISDAYLFSFMPIDELSSQATSGLTLHYDFFSITNNFKTIMYFAEYKNINFSDISLDWTFKYRYDFNSDFYWSAKAHTGFTGIAFSTSNNYTEVIPRDDYLIGANIKLLLALSHTRWGTLRFDSLLVESVNINGVSMDQGSVFFGYFDISYSYPLTKTLSLVLADSFYYLNGQYKNISDIERWFNNTRIGIAINF
jgi:hypothetical protein